jgi:hypothetical protein
VDAKLLDTDAALTVLTSGGRFPARKRQLRKVDYAMAMGMSTVQCTVRSQFTSHAEAAGLIPAFVLRRVIPTERRLPA